MKCARCNTTMTEHEVQDSSKNAPLCDSCYEDTLPPEVESDCTPSFEGGYWSDPNDPTA